MHFSQVGETLESGNSEMKLSLWDTKKDIKVLKSGKFTIIGKT